MVNQFQNATDKREAKQNDIHLMKSFMPILLLLSAMTGCQSIRPPQSVHAPELESVSTMDIQAIEDLMEGVIEMQRAYGDALSSGTVRRDGDIPSRYWSNPVKALKPIRIYEDIGNTVIVQTIIDGFEYGKYINPVYSSHMAQADFIFSARQGVVADYRRRITADVFWDRSEDYFRPKLH